MGLSQVLRPGAQCHSQRGRKKGMGAFPSCPSPHSCPEGRDKVPVLPSLGLSIEGDSTLSSEKDCALAGFP